VGETEARMDSPTILIPKDAIADFCRRWKVRELSLFGSVLTVDFRADSDIDVLIDFGPDNPWSLFDRVEMRDELAAILGRNVDIANRAAIERSANYIRRKAILGSAQTIYAAA
jgi:uncharacterized protein